MLAYKKGAMRGWVREEGKFCTAHSQDCLLFFNKIQLYNLFYVNTDSTSKAEQDFIL